MAFHQITTKADKALVSATAQKQTKKLLIVITLKPAPKPTVIPSPLIKLTTMTASTRKLIPTATPIAYQNYSWYSHDSKSMQYLNGTGYATAQQDITPTAAPTAIPTKASCPQNVPSYWCDQKCATFSTDECRSRYFMACSFYDGQNHCP